jgi:hypothetical protein
MIGRPVFGISVLASCILSTAVARAQDVPGIEICTVEKTMERRTSCLQSNVEFLQKTMVRLDAQHQQKLDAANRQIDLMKANIAALEKIVGDLQAVQQKAAGDPKKTDAPPAKEITAKDTKDGAAKEGGK